MADALTLETEREPDMSRLPHIKSLIPSRWTGGSERIPHITSIQRGVLDFQPFKSITIDTAGGEEISV